LIAKVKRSPFCAAHARRLLNVFRLARIADALTPPVESVNMMCHVKCEYDASCNDEGITGDERIEYRVAKMHKMP